MGTGGESDEGMSLALTPSWAFATVIAVLVALGFFFQRSLKLLDQWLDRTKRKALISALEKIKEELILFGVLSLLMGHWIVFVAKICVKSSSNSSKFYPCSVKDALKSGRLISVSSSSSSSSNYTTNQTFYQDEYCPKGREPFASEESLEQLHRLMFVLGVTHVSYSFFAIALAMIKIYSWRTWENQAKSIAAQSEQGSANAETHARRLRRLSTFISHHTSHPWSRHRVLVWLLCFSRQFWSSINQTDYKALRLGFITTHQLSLTYDFLNYMLRSMEEEFRDTVGISVPLWIYAILSIFLNFHGTHIYFWLSFLPAILILIIGTKLHRVVVKLAVEIRDTHSAMEHHRFHLRDDLFWFRKPRLLLRLIQLISFQNAFEMATFLWSMWETKGSPSCFMENQWHIGIRLIFGVVSQFWCSFITFPIYVIITQMGAHFKKAVVSENVRESLRGWQRRAKAKQNITRHGGRSTSVTNAAAAVAANGTTQTENGDNDASAAALVLASKKGSVDALFLHQEASTSRSSHNEECTYDHSDDDDDDDDDDEDEDDENYTVDQNNYDHMRSIDEKNAIFQIQQPQ